MDTRDLEYVLAVHAHGGIGRAAEALGLSQPALSKAMHRVEAAVGLPLFERGPNGMIATQAGLAFIARAQRIRLEFEDAMKEARGLKGGELGLLRLGCSPSIPGGLMMAAIRQFLRERPVARLSLQRRFARDLIEMVAEGQLELVVVPLSEAMAPELQFRELFDDRLTVIADESHPLQGRRNLGLGDLAGEDWLLPGAQFAVRKQIEQAFATKGLPAPNLRVEADFVGSLTFDLIRGSRMLTVGGAEIHGITEGLRPLHLRADELELRRKVGIVTRARGYVSPLAERMMTLLAERRH